MDFFQRVNSFFFLKILLIFREGTGGRKRREGREKERERNVDVREKHLAASDTLPVRNLACNPGLCPDRKSNQRPFSSQAGTQSTEPHQPGLKESIP